MMSKQLWQHGSANGSLNVVLAGVSAVESLATTSSGLGAKPFEIGM